MKLLVWIITAIVAAGWTGLAAVLAFLAGWVANHAGTLPNWPDQLSNWPLPQWLVLWLDSTLLQGVRTALGGLVQWTSGLLPAITP